MTIDPRLVDDGRHVRKLQRTPIDHDHGDRMKLALVAVVLLGTLSCSDSTGPSGTEGTVSFTYTGAGGGSFNASGNAPSFTIPPTGTSWAVGYVDAGDTYIVGSRPRSGGLQDLAGIRLGRTTTGSAIIDPTCNIDSGTSCTGMELLLNFNGNGDTADFFCDLTSGTIVVTEMTTSRAKGTFSGSGTCVTGTGGASSAFSVSDGTFDVAMVTPPA